MCLVFGFVQPPVEVMLESGGGAGADFVFQLKLPRQRPPTLAIQIGIREFVLDSAHVKSSFFHQGPAASFSNTPLLRGTCSLPLGSYGLDRPCRQPGMCRLPFLQNSLRDGMALNVQQCPGEICRRLVTCGALQTQLVFPHCLQDLVLQECPIGIPVIPHDTIC